MKVCVTPPRERFWHRAIFGLGDLLVRAGISLVIYGTAPRGMAELAAELQRKGIRSDGFTMRAHVNVAAHPLNPRHAITQFRPLVVRA